MDSHIHEWEDVVWNGIRSRQCTICGRVEWSCSERRMVDEEPYLKRIAELEAERDALRDELAELKARRCETCKKWYPFGCWVRNEILEDRGHPAGSPADIYCSEWEPRKTEE